MIKACLGKSLSWVTEEYMNDTVYLRVSKLVCVAIFVIFIIIVIYFVESNLKSYYYSLVLQSELLTFSDQMELPLFTFQKGAVMDLFSD